MPDLPDDLTAAVDAWLQAFGAAAADADEQRLRELVVDDAYWRDVVALTGDITTTHTRDVLVPELLRCADAAGFGDITRVTDYSPPSVQPRGSRTDVVEAFYSFTTELFDGLGVLRLVPVGDGELRMLALMTSARTLRDRPEPVGAQRPDLLPPTPPSDDPEVVIVGAGQSGLCLAARLALLDVPTVVVEQHPRVGDNWRTRYAGLKLHNIIEVNEFPFASFPTTFPTYLPKDVYGDWLESYAQNLRLPVRTSTRFQGGSNDEGTGRWTVTVQTEGEPPQTLHPRHVVLATGGFASVPNVPELPGVDAFDGPVRHTTQIAGAEELAGQKVLVVGTGTSAHDLTQQLVRHGAEVTMVQRSPTNVISQAAANIYLSLFLERPAEEVDLVLAANSVEVTLEVFRVLTGIATEMDAELIAGLERAGFRTSRGVDDAGYFWDFLHKGGSYYIDVGASQLILDGTVKVIDAATVARYGPSGAELTDGTTVEADAIVLATGFAPQELEVEALFGAEIAGRVGRIWGFGDDGELRNAWRPTGQEGLWMMNGGVPHARDHSRHLALQITARLLGLPIAGRERVAVG